MQDNRLLYPGAVIRSESCISHFTEFNAVLCSRCIKYDSLRVLSGTKHSRVKGYESVTNNFY